MLFAKRTHRLFGNNLWLAFFLMSLLLVTSAGCDAGEVTDCFSDAFSVTTTEDINDGQCTPGHCSLREAIIAANSCSARSIREILLGRGTYTLTLRGPGDDRGDLNITSPMRIVGEDSDLTIIQGGDGWNDRIFAVAEHSEVEFRLLTIQGGNSSADGGAILNHGNIGLTNVHLASNSADGDGGALFSTGGATLRSVEVTGNSTDRFGSGCGGGLHNLGFLWIYSSLIERNNSINGHGICNERAGYLQIRDSRILNNGNEAIISNNAGGGIFISSWNDAFINDTIIQGNRAASGGGLYASSQATLVRLIGVTVSENLARHVRNRLGEYEKGEGGGLYLSADNFIIIDSLIIDNQAEENGGGIYVASHDESLDRIEHTAIARNTAIQGGGVYMDRGEMLFRNVTISSNRADFGSAILNGAPGERVISMVHVTIANNGPASSGLAGSALEQEGGASSSFTISHTLIVDNLGLDCFPVLFWVNTGGYNYAEGDACFINSPTDLSGTPADIALRGLTEIDGTLLHLLGFSSSAVDFIPASEPLCLEDDQRHTVRPFADWCDIGAYEYEFGGSASEAIESGGTPEVLVFNTPTPGGPPTVIITTDTLCLRGPSANDYEVVNTLTQGLVGQLIGAGETGQGNDDWLVMSHPNLPDTDCWVDANYAIPSIPFAEMRLIFVPLAPTATPKPTREPGSPPPSDDGPGPEPACVPEPNIPNKCD